MKKSATSALKAKFPGTTVNDIFAALMVMCVRRYLEGVKDPIVGSGRSIRASFPVNLRKKVRRCARLAARGLCAAARPNFAAALPSTTVTVNFG